MTPFEFQSTFPRGERRLTVQKLGQNKNFNPRSRVGNDSQGVTCIAPWEDFNPRSRVGNDGRSSWYTYRGKEFQSTFPRGERLLECLIKADSLLFQSTFPRGERPEFYFVCFAIRYFNPRSRVGNDSFRVYP